VKNNNSVVSGIFPAGKRRNSSILEKTNPMKFRELFKQNRLSPLGLLGAVLTIAGVFFPWQITTLPGGRTFMENGTLDILGWVLILLSVVYTLVLYTHFKWNILLAAGVKGIALYEYFRVMLETRSNPDTEPGLGVYFLLFSGLLMILGTVLLFRSKKPVRGYR
jgi:hypothetical protein